MAAAAENKRIFYDTLTELDAAAQQLRRVLDGKTVRDFNPNNNLVVNIFSNQIPIQYLKPPAGERPIIIITAGSPGVGKSTVAKEQFEKFGVNPNMIYTVSMDTLLERNTLFRKATKNLYNEVHHKKGKLNNANYATFSGIPAAAYAAKQANLKIPQKIASIRQKYTDSNAALNNAALSNAFKQISLSKPKSQTMRKKSVAQTRSRSPLRLRTPSRSRSPTPPPKSPPKSPPKTTLRRSSRLAAINPKKGGAIEHNLDDIREIGFEFGVANGLNILYDCTLTSTNRRMSAIMDVLEKYAEMGRPKYQIKILLIKADDNMDEAARIIQGRIRGRHRQMINNGFLRALSPSIGVVKNMIQTNKDGFDVAQEIYSEKIKNSFYGPSDFYFEEILNPQH